MPDLLGDDARSVILARIRSALGPDPTAPDIPRDYRRAAPEPPGDLELLADRLLDYKATVVHTTPDDLAADLAKAVDGIAPLPERSASRATGDQGTRRGRTLAVDQGSSSVPATRTRASTASALIAAARHTIRGVRRSAPS